MTQGEGVQRCGQGQTLLWAVRPERSGVIILAQLTLGMLVGMLSAGHIESHDKAKLTSGKVQESCL